MLISQISLPIHKEFTLCCYTKSITSKIVMATKVLATDILLVMWLYIFQDTAVTTVLLVTMATQSK